MTSRGISPAKDEPPRRESVEGGGAHARSPAMMNSDTTSHWMRSAPLPVFPRLETDLTVDVVVVGGGLMGLTTAYLAQREGRRVAVLERGRCAAVDTGHTTAHVTAVTDASRGELIARFGRAGARAAWEAGMAALEQMERIVREEEIDCDWRRAAGYLHAPLEPDAGVERAREAWFSGEAEEARSLGIDAAFHQAVPVVGRPGVAFPNQALFHPLKYLASLAQRIVARGGQVFEQSAVEEIADEPLVVTAAGHRVRCTHVVLATHNPIMGLAGILGAALFQTKLALYSSYALGARIPRQAVSPVSFWDTAEPYHYLRIEPRGEHDYAIFGGEDHKTGQVVHTGENYLRLEQSFRRLFPDAVVDARWSGQVIETTDGLPYIGELVPHQFGGTGFSGNGMTFGTLAAMMAVDWIAGRTNPWQALLAPGRKKAAVATYVAENKDFPLHFLRDWIAPADRVALGEIARGEGRVISLNGHKVAAHRQEDGGLSLCSAVCTHLKCIVAWNEAERTWDCPCHGSRFTPSGDVISGPAEAPLPKIVP